MPLTDETFVTVAAGVAPIEPNANVGQQAQIELQFGFGNGPEAGMDQQVFVRRTRLAPQTAIVIGEAMVEEGKRLAALPDLALVTDMKAAEAEAEALAKLT